MVRVVAAVVIEEGRVMAVRRGPGMHLAGFWEFPGGKVEAGEADKVALAREIQEELGIGVQVGGCLGENSHDGPGKSICLVAYYAEITEGRPVLSEHDGIVWIEPESLGTLKWAPADIPFVQQIISG
jgi:8-oxo-dGTP diphosphatase